MTNPSERLFNIKTSAIIKIVVILLALGFLWLVRDILALLFVALFLAALMNPAALWAAKKRIPKGLVVLLVYILLLAALGALSALIIPTLTKQFGNLYQSLGAFVLSLSGSIQILREYVGQYGFIQDLTTSFDSIQGQASWAAGGLYTTLTGFFGGLAGLLIVMVMAYYMVVEEKEAVRLFQNLVPKKYQDISAKILTQVQMKIGNWLGGQLALSLIIGVLYYIGLLILGVESALALAVFAGFLEFIPYLGPILGGIPIVIVAFSDSPFKAVLALGLVILIQQLENHAIVPKLMQKAVGLNPLISIVAVLIGAKLFGVVGVLLAVPVATAISVVLTEVYKYKQIKT
ncbi:MAG: AI-2E family transporter [Patescibacteria group bacterium]|nr:AI-2E family transporter [Patescibacteria group bacterium]